MEKLHVNEPSATSEWRQEICRARLAALRSTVDEMSVRTIGAKQELRWPIPGRFGHPVRVTRLLLRLFLTEAYLLFFKRARLLIHQAFSQVGGNRS